MINLDETECASIVRAVQGKECPTWCVSDHADEWHWSDYCVPEVWTWPMDPAGSYEILALRLGKTVDGPQTMLYADVRDRETGEYSNLFSVPPMQALELSKTIGALLGRLSHHDLTYMISGDTGMRVEEDLLQALNHWLETRGCAFDTCPNCIVDYQE